MCEPGFCCIPCSDLEEVPEMGKKKKGKKPKGKPQPQGNKGKK